MQIVIERLRGASHALKRVHRGKLHDIPNLHLQILAPAANLVVVDVRERGDLHQMVDQLILQGNFAFLILVYVYLLVWVAVPAG